MRKQIMAICVAAVLSACGAQETGKTGTPVQEEAARDVPRPHMTFKGVEIKGSFTAFRDSMAGHGLEYRSKADGTHLFRGPFGGFLDCDVRVMTAPGDRYVWAVSVSLPSRGSWEYVRKAYGTLKDALVEKHGMPESQVERFPVHGGGKEDAELYMEAARGKCEYCSRWVTVSGGISLEVRAGRVTVDYVDGEGGDRMMKEMADEI